MLIYDNTLDFLVDHPSTTFTIATYTLTFASLHMWYFMSDLPMYLWGGAGLLSVIGWLQIVSAWSNVSKQIA